MRTERRRAYPCDFKKACYVKWLVLVQGVSLTQAAILVRLNVGTVCHIIHGRRFPDSFPVPMPDEKSAA